MVIMCRINGQLSRYRISFSRLTRQVLASEFIFTFRDIGDVLSLNNGPSSCTDNSCSGSYLVHSNINNSRAWCQHGNICILRLIQIKWSDVIESMTHAIRQFMFCIILDIHFRFDKSKLTTNLYVNQWLQFSISTFEFPKPMMWYARAFSGYPDFFITFIP